MLSGRAGAGRARVSCDECAGCCDGQHSPGFVPFPLRLVTIGQAFKVLEGS